MSAKIDCFVDFVSPYSYFAFLRLRRDRAALLSYGVEVEFHPIYFMGVINGSDNTTPYKPVKQRHRRLDFTRARDHFGVPGMKLPSTFPVGSLYPQRCLTYIKAAHSRERYEKCFEKLWEYLWLKDINVSEEENLRRAFGEILNDDQVNIVLEKAKEQEVKDKLAENTKRAVDSGAFGAPWMIVKNKDGKEQVYFGSDRFHFMFSFLRVPFEDVKIKGKASL